MLYLEYCLYWKFDCHSQINPPIILIYIYVRMIHDVHGCLHPPPQSCGRVFTPFLDECMPLIFRLARLSLLCRMPQNACTMPLFNYKHLVCQWVGHAVIYCYFNFVLKFTCTYTCNCLMHCLVHEVMPLFFSRSFGIVTGHWPRSFRPTCWFDQLWRGCCVQWPCWTEFIEFQ